MNRFAEKFVEVCSKHYTFYEHDASYIDEEVRLPGWYWVYNRVDSTSFDSTELDTIEFGDKPTLTGLRNLLSRFDDTNRRLLPKYTITDDLYQLSADCLLVRVTLPEDELVMAYLSV
jgi:hypothetical protein